MLKADPPCKFWRKRYQNAQGDEGTLKWLDDIWSMSLPQWAMRHPYLASPSASCECMKCRKGDKP